VPLTFLLHRDETRGLNMWLKPPSSSWET